MIVVINKMDLSRLRRKRLFTPFADQFGEFAASLRGVEFEFVPLSALNGENVIHCNGNIPWYKGPTLLQILETVPATPEPNQEFRFAVQNVIRPNQDFRGYAGQVGSGIVRPGQEVVALPSGQRTTIKEILLYDRKSAEAFPPQSVVLTTTDHIDLGRGDMLVSAENLPTVSARITANLIWMSQGPLRRDTRYLIKHTTKVLCGRISRLNHKIDVNTLAKVEADSLQFNEIGEA